MSILITGGAGYIGSHATLSILRENHEVVVLDDFSNGSPAAVNRVAELAGRHPTLVEGSITDADLLEQIFRKFQISAVLHFAGLKAVGESHKLPLAYYEQNVAGTLTLLRCMNKANIKKLIFSSSATVYGEQATSPCVESSRRGGASNPYGTTKSMIEKILEDLAVSDPDWAICCLRYFNPIGAHESGAIGEAPQGVPNNLMPIITQVALGRRSFLEIYGDDYETPDGTCRRDYVHVMDVAEGHVAALNHLVSGFEAINLGTGKPTSVLELVNVFQRYNDVLVPCRVVGRRLGDVAELWADVEKAKSKISWSAKRSVEDMVVDSWRWQCSNPTGYTAS